MTSTVEVTLRSIDKTDDFEERKILMGPSKSIPVGRSSKNATKNLLAASDNAYINSPVISREHATLTTTTPANAPGPAAVYLADNGSMHGTYVNGVRLQRGIASKLSNGDLLRFGDNVVRDHDSFVAKSYRYSSHICPPVSRHHDASFPRGFTAPDLGTSDEEEDVHSDDAAPQSPPARSYGSEANPVNVDDFEDTPPVPLPPTDLIEIYPARIATPIKSRQTEDTQVKSSPPPCGVYSVQADLSDDQISDEEEEGQDYPDEESDQSMSTNSSEDEFESERDDEQSVKSNADVSDVESVSESEASADEQEMDHVRRVKLGAMLNHEQQKIDDPISPRELHILPPQPPSPLGPSSTCTYPKLPHPAGFYNSANFVPRGMNNDNEQDKFRGMEPGTMFPDAYAANWNAIDFVTPVLMREQPQNNPWYDDTAPMAFNDYTRETIPNYNRPNIYHPTPFAEPGPSSLPRPASPFAKHPDIDVPAPLPELHDAAETPNQPASRTKVSIAEIVDHSPQQPPTPTSVASPPSLKRKAEALEDEKPADELVALVEAVKDENTAVPQAAQDVQVLPPKKKARRTLGPLASGMAGFVLGGAAVVSALLFTPERIVEQILS